MSDIKLNPLKHRISKKDMTVSIAIEEIIFDMPSQIDPEKASGLIENIILQAPIHHLVVRLTNQGKYNLLDGSWRLGIISSFIDGKFAITNSGYFPHLEGKKYNELIPQIKRRIQEHRLTIIILEPHMTQEMNDLYIRQINLHKDEKC